MSYGLILSIRITSPLFAWRGMVETHVDKNPGTFISVIFFIKDRIRAGNVSVEFCPTELMLADFFTKPLQGSLFQKFRRVVMGYDPLSVLQDEYSARLKERAEK